LEFIHIENTKRKL